MDAKPDIELSRRTGDTGLSIRERESVMDAIGWKVVGSVKLQDHHRPSRTRHTINGVSAPPFTRLEITTYGQDAGFYLLHICSDGQGTDSWHETLEAAFDQAEFELGVKRHEWIMRTGQSA
jgi:hypothetical protein